MQDAPNHMNPLPARTGRSKSFPARRCPVILCLLVLARPVFADAPAPQPSSETVIRLHATAVVTGQDVLLSDVATLEGEASELAAGWSVAAAPQPGSSGSIDIQHIQKVLARRGVNLSRWIFRGSSRCVITRPADIPARSRARTSVTAGPVPSNRGTRRAPATRPAESDRPGRAARPDPTTLEGVIHDHLQNRLGDVDGELSIRFSPVTARLLGLSANQYQFRILDRGEKKLGMVPLEVTVLEQGQVRQVVQVVCQASLARPVVVAGRSLNRGELIQPGDLICETRTFETLEKIGLTNPAPLIGQRTRRLIRLGEQIDTSDIEPVPLVERNDLVTVSIRRGALGITATARALSSGSYGDSVSLRSELSKDTFVGTVVGPRMVVLSEAAQSPDGGDDANPPGPATVAIAGGNR